MYDTGLADRIRAKGVTVVEVAGWKTRGNSSGFNPRGAIHHHTAGSSRGATPSLNTCIYGRPDVPGPLCQVMQSRESDPADDKAYVIAAGKANHGGVGHWDNPATGERINSNYESMGLEVEHIGTTTAPARRHEISCRILAAFLEAPGSSHDWRMCCEHYEYADPDGRKVDFRELNPPFANRADGVRERVKFWIGRTSQEEEDFMAELSDKEQRELYDWMRQMRVSTVPFAQDAQPPDERFQVQELLERAFTKPGSGTRIALVGTQSGETPAIVGLVEHGLARSKSFKELVAKVDHITEMLHATEPPPGG